LQPQAENGAAAKDAAFCSGSLKIRKNPWIFADFVACGQAIA
jgi:hypothetical protein